MEWDKRMTLELIDLYKSKSVLWNPENRLYKNLRKRNEEIEDISRTLGIKKEEVERKIKNLQGQFLRETKKFYKIPRYCQNGTGGYESKWFAFKALQFLKERKSTRSRRLNNTTQEGNGENLIEFSVPSPLESEQNAEPYAEPSEHFARFAKSCHSSIKRSFSFCEEPSLELPTNVPQKVEGNDENLIEFPVLSSQEFEQSLEPDAESSEHLGSHSSIKHSLSFCEDPSVDLPTNVPKKFCSVYVNEEGTGDEYDVAGRKYAFDLRALSDQQRIICEKIVSDAIYYGKLGRLTEESSIKLC